MQTFTDDPLHLANEHETGPGQSRIIGNHPEAIVITMKLSRQPKQIKNDPVRLQLPGALLDDIRPLSRLLDESHLFRQRKTFHFDAPRISNIHRDSTLAGL